MNYIQESIPMESDGLRLVLFFSVAGIHALQPPVCRGKGHLKGPHHPLTPSVHTMSLTVEENGHLKGPRHPLTRYVHTMSLTVS